MRNKYTSITTNIDNNNETITYGSVTVHTPDCSTKDSWSRDEELYSIEKSKKTLLDYKNWLNGANETSPSRKDVTESIDHLVSIVDSIVGG